MAIRETISKRTRFEVFKRDKFTCQYCGQKAPDVVLNVDHINPVANGGDNDLMNLITSCFSCNNGKSDKTLSDFSTVEKQRKQIELLQERREQIELMMEWKSSLSKLDDEVTDTITSYVNKKIEPFSVNDKGKKDLASLIEKYGIEKLLDAVDVAAKKYIKYEDGKVTSASASMFFSKIGGILVVKGLSPVKQKLAYIKGIARNRFSYWNDRTGSMILNQYVAELEKHYDEERLLKDLEDEVEKLTKEAKHWSEWRGTLEKWTSDVAGWAKPQIEEQESEANVESSFVAPADKIYSLEQLQGLISDNFHQQTNSIKALIYIAKAFPDFDREMFTSALNVELTRFIPLINKPEIYSSEHDDLRMKTMEFIEESDVAKFLQYDYEVVSDWGMLIVLESICSELLIDIFMFCCYSTWRVRQEYKSILAEIALNKVRDR